MFYLFKKSLQNIIFLDSINEVINNEEIDKKINKDGINFPKKDNDERFSE